MRFEIGNIKITKGYSHKSENGLPFEMLERELREVKVPAGTTKLKNVIYDYHYEREIIVGGFASLNDAKRRVEELLGITKGGTCSIHQSGNEFCIEMPPTCKAFLKEEEIANIRHNILKSDVFMPCVYRFFTKEQYVKDFFEKGSLLISNINRCRGLDEKNRADIYEARNYFVIRNGQYELCADVASGIDNLLLCTSLSRRNYNENHEEYKYGFRINNVQAFIRELTFALVRSGIKIKCAWHGPCIYDNKIIINNNSEYIHNFIQQLVDEKKFNADVLCEAILNEGGEKIFFNKPVAYDIDNEYRFVWALEEQPVPQKTQNIEVLPDGAIIIKAPELIQYCEML